MALQGLIPKNIIFVCGLGFWIASCTGNYQAIPSTSTTTTTSTTVLQPGQDEPAARIIFHQDFFTDVDDYNPDPAYHPSILTEYRCPGDLIKTFYANGGDYSSTPTSMGISSTNDTFQPTYRPLFLKNVSVDITNSYFPSVMMDLFLSDVCSHRQTENSPLPSSCADFDRVPYSLSNVPVATSTPTPMPTPTTNEYFNSGFYRVRDDWCIAQGPVVQPDPEATKQGVGGVSIDIDRTQLGTKEDLLMVVTYHALNENSKAGNWPASQAVDGTPTAGVPPTVSSTDHAQTDRTILKVNLVGTGEALDTILGVRQPRVWAYTNQASYPIYHKEIATLEDPFGSLRSEQVYLPISQNSFIDRIRIERDRGSYHLFQIDLYRMGNRIE